jgi:hypothetical protein
MTAIRTVLATALAFGCIGFSVTEASATSLAVKMACASDYYAHCSQHDPNGSGVRKCMRSVGKNLSQGCINALVAAGEVSKSVVEKKVASN